MARTISIAGPQFLTQQRSWRQLSAATHSHSKTLACPFPSRQIDTNSYHPDRCRYEKACKAFQEDNGGLQRSPARAVNLEGADAYVDSDTGTHPSGQQHSEALPVGMAPGAGQIGSSETWRTKQVRTPMRVLLFVPNLLGYARLVLLACAVHAFCVAQAQASCFWMLIASLSLDFLDGMLARRLGQVRGNVA